MNWGVNIYVQNFGTMILHLPFLNVLIDSISFIFVIFVIVVIVFIVVIVVFFPEGLMGWLKRKFPEKFGEVVDKERASGIHLD